MARAMTDGEWMLTDAEKEEEATDRFVHKYGRSITDIYEFLMSIQDPDDFYRYGQSLTAAIGVAAQTRLKGLDKDVQ